MPKLSDVGITSVYAKSQLEKYGLNHVSQRRTWWQIFTRQFKSPFIYLLLGASVVSGLLSSPTDALAILAFIVINTVLGFYQEFTSENTIRALEDYLKFHTTVFRDGVPREIPNSYLVPEDVVHLHPGNIIPADIIFLEATGLLVDESSISGESTPLAKKSDDFGYAGTSISSGSGIAKITATGKNSTLGRIALASQIGGNSTFEKDIASFSSFVLKLVLVTLSALFIINFALKGQQANLAELLLFCIALAVSVVPEALPLVITFSLSRGAAHLAKNKVVVKKLLSIEDLGGIQILATDKTGTLTDNHLSVQETYPISVPNLLLWSLAGSEDAFTTKKMSDPFDIALMEALTSAEKKAFSKMTLVNSSPFDPVHRTASTIVKSPKNQFFTIRGAPENTLPLCHLSSQEIQKMSDWIDAQGQSGCRVLAVAQISYTNSQIPLHFPNKLNILGLVSFTDPVKKTAVQAIDIAEKLGVGIRVITGDSPQVATAVAKQIGLIKSSSQVITGDNFENLTETEKLAKLDSYLVFARTSPFQKNAIVDLLQTKYSVGYLGDGINDTIALDSADVGLAVSNASQVARQAADIVLLEKDLKVIVNGIREGRVIAANTSKYITATMASNFGNFYAVAVSSLFIPFLPMLPLQLLALNLLSDFPMISIATDNVDPDETVSPTRFHVHSFIDLAMVLGVVSTIFDFLFFALYFRISAATLQTNWFIGSILTELVLIYSIRTKKLFIKSRWPSITLVVLTSLALLITILIPYTKFGQTIFSFSSPGLKYLITDLLLVMAYFVATETVKLIYFRYRHKNT